MLREEGGYEVIRGSYAVTERQIGNSWALREEPLPQGATNPSPTGKGGLRRPIDPWTIDLALRAIIACVEGGGR